MFSARHRGSPTSGMVYVTASQSTYVQVPDDTSAASLLFWIFLMHVMLVGNANEIEGLAQLSLLVRNKVLKAHGQHTIWKLGNQTLSRLLDLVPQHC